MSRRQKSWSGAVSDKPVAATILLLVLIAKLALAASNEELAGGETTAFDQTRDAFSLSARNLTDDHSAPFFVGRSFFHENWLAATASVSSRDGLGPLFVARSCAACHAGDGRSSPPPEGGLPVETMVVRISLPGTNTEGGPKPDPVYGLQLQTHALPEIPAEARLLVTYQSIRGTYDDGEEYYLRQPGYQVTDFGYGPLSAEVTLSPLVAPAIIGLGLLEAVPEETLRRLADQDRHRSDGISGKVNIVWDTATGRTTVGRFGWKAEQPSVRQQCAAAFNGDMGLTTSLFPGENHTPVESICTNLPSGGSPEVSDEIFDAVVLYSRLLAVPARRDLTNEMVLRGQKLFQELNCAVCHMPELKTGTVPGFPEVSQQTIHSYTDLLLHDLGDGLADQRQVFAAGGREWRTPPLWGAGLIGMVNNHNCLLHDGRARGFAEAILWHGGEAESAREQFRMLKKSDRDALVRFLESL